MADYYSILARAVSGLDPNTPAARRRLYERARSALVSEMQNVDPPIPRSEIIVAQMALDTAIGQVEADACLLALEKSGERVEWDLEPTVPESDEPVEEYLGPYQGAQPNPVAPASLIPTRVAMPRQPPANQNLDRRGSRYGIRRLLRWRSTHSEISEEEEAGRNTWLTELLERASDEGDQEFQSFAPRQPRSGHG
jgi:hypothetical protein